MVSKRNYSEVWIPERGSAVNDYPLKFRYIYAFLIGAAVSLVGCFQHRFYVNWYVPLGLIGALILIFAGSLTIRFWTNRLGVVIYGLGVYLVIAIVWVFNNVNMIFVSSWAQGEMEISQYASYIFLGCGLGLSLINVILPNRWFENV